jgi:hypothetical protein
MSTIGYRGREDRHEFVELRENGKMGAHRKDAEDAEKTKSP